MPQLSKASDKISKFIPFSLISPFLPFLGLAKICFDLGFFSHPLMILNESHLAAEWEMSNWVALVTLRMAVTSVGKCQTTHLLPSSKEIWAQSRLCWTFIHSFCSYFDSRNSTPLSQNHQYIGKERGLLCSWALKGTAAGKVRAWQIDGGNLDWLWEGGYQLCPIVLLLKSYLKNVASNFTYHHIDLIRHVHKLKK